MESRLNEYKEIHIIQSLCKQILYYRRLTQYYSFFRAYMEPIKVVAHFLDGSLLKGYVQEFNPAQTFFHLLKDTTSGNKLILIKTIDLKAIFFVKTLDYSSS